MRTGLSAVVLVLFAATAQAQEQESARLELGAGAGYARSLHGDLYFGGAAISGTARVRMSSIVAFEAQVGYWQHTDHESFRTQTGDIVNISDSDRFTSVTASVIGRAPRRMKIARTAAVASGSSIATATASRPPGQRRSRRTARGGSSPAWEGRCSEASTCTRTSASACSASSGSKCTRSRIPGRPPTGRSAACACRSGKTRSTSIDRARERPE